MLVCLRMPWVCRCAGVPMSQGVSRTVTAVSRASRGSARPRAANLSFERFVWDSRDVHYYGYYAGEFLPAVSTRLHCLGVPGPGHVAGGATSLVVRDALVSDMLGFVWMWCCRSRSRRWWSTLHRRPRHALTTKKRRCGRRFGPLVARYVARTRSRF